MLTRSSFKRSVPVLARRYAASQQIRGRSFTRPLASRHCLVKSIACDRHSNVTVSQDQFAFLPSQYCRHFSSMEVIDVSAEKPIRILYGSQGGTAQMFGMQLDSEVEDREVTTLGLHESSSPQEIFDPTCIHVILISVAGIGEPPDNARAFYEWLMSAQAEKSDVDWNVIQYTVFGLGNKKAHPNHYNVIGKDIDRRLQELGAVRVHDVGLGDDGECIEDDFDVWLGGFLKTLHGEEIDTAERVDMTDELSSLEGDKKDSHGSSKQRVASKKHPALLLVPPTSDIVREDLFHLQTTSNPFYQSNFSKLTVTGNDHLNARSAEYGLRELVIAKPDSTYVAGDHFCVYPKNSHFLVEAYLQMLNIDPHVVIQQADSTSKSYPRPTGITLFETLLHCVDLGAVPSPSFSRDLMGRKEINYKEEVVFPRRTVLDLALEHSSATRLSLEDFLYNMEPMQPRYYSIASSPRVHPHEVYLTYRPVKYVSSRGSIREGTCTTYLSNLAQESQVIGTVRSNPSFRLPEDSSVSVLMMAGGCGIAAIRAFLEERMALSAGSNFGEGHLFLGFRSPSDEVYRDLVEDALQSEVLSNVQVSYSSGCTEPNQHCRLVSETVRANGHVVWDLFENGGYTYLCGGARTFGLAIEREVLTIIQEHGKMNEEDALQYLRQLIKDGRFCEDLAD